MKYVLYSDGGSRGNPGPAASGAVLFKAIPYTLSPIPDALEKVGSWGKYLGIATNNHAEYQALILGLQKAREHGVTELECRLDSELLVKQMKREYRVKHKDLAPLFMQAWNLAGQFSRISFHHVPREENIEADRMVNAILDDI